MDAGQIFLIVLGILACLIVFLIICARIHNTFVIKRNNYDALCEKKEQEFKIKSESLEQALEKEKKQLSKLEQELTERKEFYEHKIAELDQIIEKKCAYYPQLAGAIADIKTLCYEQSAKYLSTKPNPAIKEAQRIRELKKETKQILREKKELEYKYNYIVSLFPAITDIFDDGFNDEYLDDLVDSDKTDRVRYFISDEEYKSLSVTDRNQLALDNYLARPKTKWQIGRDYEMSIAYKYARKGYSVEYNGIIKNLEDMGRDIIAQKGYTTLIIQCKNWSKEKTIHEKHIFQLYGTVIMYKIEHPLEEVKGIFITTTTLSITAKDVARFLNITIRESYPMQDFPRIKCNINKTTHEKIYHLPFDQQYDKVVIEENKDECFVYTVKEAENLGFRRAFRWHAEAI